MSRPRRKLVPILRYVRCPLCGGKYRTQVSTVWYWRQVRKTFGFPELTCVPCLRADALAKAAGGVWSDFRNPELDCYDQVKGAKSDG